MGQGKKENSQKKDNMKNTTNSNPLLCDPAEGICGIPNNSSNSDITLQKTEKPVKLIYFTDPICSSCWGIEPQLRKLKLEYGEDIEIEYRMGGLLPDWSYNGGGISKPSDVAHHWDEASAYYDMPIDGDLWIEDPLDSSYPPSIAFKAAQIQDPDKALLFLRELKEMVFLKKKNIAKWQQIETAAQICGLDVKLLKEDFDNKAKELFQEDLKLSREYAVRGFPTIFFVNAEGKKETVHGSQPYSFYQNAVLKIYPSASKKQYDRHWKALFSKYQSLTAREFSELSDLSRTESEFVLNELSNAGRLKKFKTKNGSLWTII
ncbi:hypothetical protein AAFH68_17080 [Flavobacterium sp. CGRL1]